MHIIKFIGSYTNLRYIAIIMSPVADYNLEVFLEDLLISNGSSLLRTSLSYLIAIAVTGRIRGIALLVQY